MPLPLEPNSLALYTGSAPGHDPRYARAAAIAAREIAQRGISLVYGGGNVGLMGVVADRALAAGGTVIGVMPRALVAKEIAHPGLTRLDIVENMHERKARMAQLAGGFIALPGGTGTLEEFFEVWTWQQLGLHHKPVALLNVDGFWDPLLAMVDHMIAAGFIAARFRDSLIVESEIIPLLDRLLAWTPPAEKWPVSAHK